MATTVPPKLTPPARPLAYAPRPPVHRRRAFGRWLAVGFVLFVVATGSTWLPPVWRRGRLLLLQHRCMAYAAPAGQVVADLRSSPPTGVVPPDWAAFYALLSPPGFRSDGTVFLHERRTPDGRSRLVAVDVVDMPGDATRACCRVIAGGTLARPPRPTLDWTTEEAWTTDDLQFRAGVADPADPTHFTFNVIDAGHPVTYDGWLGDDDAVRLERRMPSVTPAPPPAAPRRTAAP